MTQDSGHLLRGSSWVMAGFLVQAGTGSVFWLLAARVYPASSIGLAAALFSSLQFVNYSSALGLQELLSRFPRDEVERVDHLLVRAYVATTISSALATMLYLSVVDTDAIAVLKQHGGTGIVLFWALSTGAAIALLTDVRLMAARRWRVVFIRLSVAGVVRLPLLAVPPPIDDSLWIFVVIIGPIAVSGVVAMLALPRLTNIDFGLRRHRGVRSGRQLVRFAVANWLAELAVQAPQFVLPVVVLVHVDPVDNASFFLVWTIASVVFVLPVTVGRVLLVETSRGPAIPAPARPAFQAAVGGTVLALVVSLAVARPFIGAFYGRDYKAAANLLPGLVLGGIPWSVTSINLSRARLRHDHLTTVVSATTLAVVAVGIAVLLVGCLGTSGAVVGWIVANSLAAAVSSLLSIRWRSRHAEESLPSPTGQVRALQG